MAPFDVHRLESGILVFDLQTDLIGIDASRIVALLREAGRYVVFPGLTPTVEFGGTTWIVRVQELAAVAGTALRAGRQPRHPPRRPETCVDILIGGVRPPAGRKERGYWVRGYEIPLLQARSTARSVGAVRGVCDVSLMRGSVNCLRSAMQTCRT